MQEKPARCGPHKPPRDPGRSPFFFSCMPHFEWQIIQWPLITLIRFNPPTCFLQLFPPGSYFSHLIPDRGIIGIIPQRRVFLKTLRGVPLVWVSLFYLMLFLDFFFFPKDPSILTSLIVWVVVVGGAYFGYRSKNWLLAIFSNFL